MSRKFQSLTAMGSQMVMFGGQSLEDNADLNDLFFLTKVRAAACSQHCVKVHKRCRFFGLVWGSAPWFTCLLAMVDTSQHFPMFSTCQCTT